MLNFMKMSELPTYFHSHTSHPCEARGVVARLWSRSTVLRCSTKLPAESDLYDKTLTHSASKNPKG